jgi:hypothetical protein
MVKSSEFFASTKAILSFNIIEAFVIEAVYNVLVCLIPNYFLFFRERQGCNEGFGVGCCIFQDFNLTIE